MQNKENYSNNYQKRNKMSKQLISIHKICEIYQIPVSFFEDLQSYELIQLEQENETPAVPENLLPEIEKMMRLHFDLHINMEGIDVINNLVSQIEELQDQIEELQSKLSIYENL